MDILFAGEKFRWTRQAAYGRHLHESTDDDAVSFSDHICLSLVMVCMHAQCHFALPMRERLRVWLDL